MATNEEEKNHQSRIVKLTVSVEKKPEKRFEKKNSQPKKEVSANKPAEFKSAEMIVRQARLKHTHKLFVMWSGVTFFMLLIASLWIFNLRAAFSSSAASVAYDKDGQFDEFKALAEEFGAEIKEIKQVVADAKNSSSTSEALPQADGNQEQDIGNFQPLPDLGASGTAETIEVKGVNNQQIEIIKNKLQSIYAEKRQQ